MVEGKVCWLAVLKIVQMAAYGAVSRLIEI